MLPTAAKSHAASPSCTSGKCILPLATCCLALLLLVTGAHNQQQLLSVHASHVHRPMSHLRSTLPETHRLTSTRTAHLPTRTELGQTVSTLDATMRPLLYEPRHQFSSFMGHAIMCIAAGVLSSVAVFLFATGRKNAAASHELVMAAGAGEVTRRVYLGAAAAGVATAAIAPSGADAALITQFPPERLRNLYLLMRAGEGYFEATGLVRTNPILNTNMQSGLTKEGRRQAILGMNAIKELHLDTDFLYIWPSITTRSYETAEILAQGLGVPRARVVPEYTYLDARAFGAYEGKPVAQLEEVYAADRIDTSIRPPPFSDGTPNESVNDVFVRSIQLLSKLETQYNGSIVILVSPDSDNLTVLQAALTGYDMRLHHELAYQPGEVRMVNLTGAPPPLEDPEDD